MRIVLADPPAFTPAYDHELASGLARAGADVELLTSRFRFGDVPAAVGYMRSEPYYPLSSRLFGRSRLRLPLKVVEHPFGVAALNRRRADVLHVQWLVPELDARLLRPRVPSVFTAHDLLPRRTAKKENLWRDLLARFDRVVVHSERGREALAELDVDARVIPHPVFRSDLERQDDGRTVLCFGVIRPYKGLGDAIEAVRRAGDARLLVAGDPLEPVDGYRAAAAGLDVDWRLGYLPQAEVDRALGEATVAVFPYRPELDQSGALLRALGAGCARHRLRRRRHRRARAALRGRPRRGGGRRRGARGSCARAADGRRCACRGARRSDARTRRAHLGCCRPCTSHAVRGDRLMFRRRFSEVVTRQLDVFATDEAGGLLAEVREMKDKYDHADREEAEEAYGDFMDVVDAVKDALADMRDRFARTLEGDAVEEYESVFERAAKKRWRWLV